MSETHCPYCGEKWKVEHTIRLKCPQMEFYCDNPNCPIQPSTGALLPTAAIRDRDAIGPFGKEAPHEHR